MFCTGFSERTSFSAMITKTVKPELGGYSTRSYYPCFDSLDHAMPCSFTCNPGLRDVLGMQVDELCDFTRDSFTIHTSCCGKHKKVHVAKIGGRGAGDISVTGCYDVDQLIGSYLSDTKWIDNVACTCNNSPQDQRNEVESIRRHNGKTRVYDDKTLECRYNAVYASEIATFS
jgi:hypothetical protein